MITFPKYQYNVFPHKEFVINICVLLVKSIENFILKVGCDSHVFWP